MTDGLRLLCSTDFMWGAEIPEVIRLLIRAGCEGVMISTEPPHYLPSLVHRSSVSALRSVVRDLDVVVAVRAPIEDINVYSPNPHIANASVRSVEEAVRLGYSIGADFIIIRPSYRPYDGNPVVAARKLQALMSKMGRDQYAAFELIGGRSREIADRLSDPRLGIVYFHRESPPDLLSHRKLVGVSLRLSEATPLRIIPGLKGDTPSLLIHPERKRMHDTSAIRRMIVRTKSWRDGLI